MCYLYNIPPYRQSINPKKTTNRVISFAPINYKQVYDGSCMYSIVEHEHVIEPHQAKFDTYNVCGWVG